MALDLIHNPMQGVNVVIRNLRIFQQSSNVLLPENSLVRVAIDKRSSSNGVILRRNRLNQGGSLSRPPEGSGICGLEDLHRRMDHQHERIVEREPVIEISVEFVGSFTLARIDGPSGATEGAEGADATGAIGAAGFYAEINLFDPST